jgi:hypothetical protein
MEVIKALVLKLRKRIPAPMRHWLRLFKLAATKGRPSPKLPSQLIAQCRFCASRGELLKYLPHGARVAEVGVAHGHFSRRILSTTNPTELHLIDLDFGILDPSLRGDSRVRLHKGASHKMLAAFPDGSFDWIYIDGDHSYAGVRRDAMAAADKIKPGGFLAFNDFAHADPFLGTYGVHRAVVEFAVARKWPLVWWAYEPNALYDVVLKRPEGS